MSALEGYKNEIELVEGFLDETSVMLALAEACDEKIISLKEEQKEIERFSDSLLKQTKLKIIDHTITHIEKEIKEWLNNIQAIKEAYLGEDLLDTLERLTSVDETRELSDEVCQYMTKMNLLLRKYNWGFRA